MAEMKRARVSIPLEANEAQALKAYAVVRRTDLGEILDDALSFWLMKQEEKGEVEVTPPLLGNVSAGMLSQMRGFARARGMSLSATLAEAVRNLFAENSDLRKVYSLLQPAPPPTPVEKTSLPDEENAQSASEGFVMCGNCGYRWKPRGMKPARCPSCDAKDWDVRDEWLCVVGEEWVPVNKRAGFYCKKHLPPPENDEGEDE